MVLVVLNELPAIQEQVVHHYVLLYYPESSINHRAQNVAGVRKE
jgi:hypothetical protein